MINPSSLTYCSESVVYEKYDSKNKTLKFRKIEKTKKVVTTIIKNTNRSRNKVCVKKIKTLFKGNLKDLNEKEIYSAISYFFGSGKKEMARQLLIDAENKKKIEIYSKLKNYITKKKFDKAEILCDVISKFGKFKPLYNSYRRKLIGKYIELGEYGKAYYLIGKMRKSGSWEREDVIKYFKRKIKIKEKGSENISKLMEAYIKEKKWSEANEFYSFFCDIDKYFEIVLNNCLIERANCLFNKNDKEDFFKEISDLKNKMKLSRNFHEKFLILLKKICNFLINTIEKNKANKALIYINKNIVKIKEIIEKYKANDELEKAGALYIRWSTIDTKCKNDMEKYVYELIDECIMRDLLEKAYILAEKIMGRDKADDYIKERIKERDIIGAFEKGDGKLLELHFKNLSEEMQKKLIENFIKKDKPEIAEKLCELDVLEKFYKDIYLMKIKNKYIELERKYSKLGNEEKMKSYYKKAENLNNKMQLEVDDLNEKKLEIYNFMTK